MITQQYNFYNHIIYNIIFTFTLSQKSVTVCKKKGGKERKNHKRGEEQKEKESSIKGIHKKVKNKEEQNQKTGRTNDQKTDKGINTNERRKKAVTSYKLKGRGWGWGGVGVNKYRSNI